jgi:hypothetical protein
MLSFILLLIISDYFTTSESPNSADCFNFDSGMLQIYHIVINMVYNFFHLQCQKRKVLILLAVQVSLLYPSYLALSMSPARYDTRQAYMVNNFTGSLELIYHFFESSHIVGGIAMGYYLHKYHHKPLTEEERLKTTILTYNPANNTWIRSYPERDSTREGEASFLLEIGIQIPRQKKWKIEPNSKNYIIEKFLYAPICLKWIRPISCWKFDIYNYLSLGCMIRYLRESTYFTDLSEDDDLHNKPSRAHQVNLKNASNMPSFYYDMVFELGLIFPVGIYTSLVCYFPLSVSRNYNTHKNKMDDMRELDTNNIKWHRDFNMTHMFACKLGIDFCRLFKYCNNC